MSITVRRLARRQHRCDDCHSWIPKGHAYLSHTSFPSDEFAFSDTRPTRFKECASCAFRYASTNQRCDLLYPQPEGQLFEYWLGDASPALESSLAVNR